MQRPFLHGQTQSQVHASDMLYVTNGALQIPYIICRDYATRTDARYKVERAGCLTVSPAPSRGEIRGRDSELSQRPEHLVTPVARI